ncbi:MAG: aspartyl/asparaginyl beta-hydroxylase domain-containing protein [Pseudomonadota bacterium]
MLRLHVALGSMEWLIRHTTRDGQRPYFDPGDFPWCAELEAGWREIREELDEVLLHPETIPAFHELSPEQAAITTDQHWKTFVFSVFATPIRANCARCPRTAAWLQRIPGLRNALFSILSPGKHIPEHRGPYCGLLRYHLALLTPRQNAACVLTVAGETRTWQEGRSLIFDDAFPHAVRNDSGDRRVVLFADFERPLPWPLSAFNRVVLGWLAASPLAREPLARLGQGPDGLNLK